MEISKLISKFITNVFEKKYSNADSDLKNIVEAKIKEKVKKTAAGKKSKKGVVGEAKKPDDDGDNVPNWADKKPGKDDNAEKNKSGKKLSKKENKDRFMKMIASKKKNSKKGNSKG
jgi:hypothetical protein